MLYVGNRGVKVSVIHVIHEPTPLVADIDDTL